VSDTEQTCECGHHVGSHNSLLYNCMATTDGTHDTRCSCRKFAPSPSGEPPTVSDTRTLCAVCGIWQCLARHGGGFCHAVNGPSDTSCGACYANRPTVKPDLTVASEEPPGCRQRAASLHPRLGLSYACVLTAGHNGECAPGGTCFEHGPYIGKPGTTPRCPTCPSPTITFVPAAVASPIREDDDPDPVPMADSDFWESLTLLLTDTDGSGTQHGRRMKLYHHYAVRGRLLAERSRLAERWVTFRDAVLATDALLQRLASLHEEMGEAESAASIREVALRMFMSVQPEEPNAG
jgi:hypothetical protein